MFGTEGSWHRCLEAVRCGWKGFLSTGIRLLTPPWRPTRPHAAASVPWRPPGGRTVPLTPKRARCRPVTASWWSSDHNDQGDGSPANNYIYNMCRAQITKKTRHERTKNERRMDGGSSAHHSPGPNLAGKQGLPFLFIDLGIPPQKPPFHRLEGLFHRPWPLGPPPPPTGRTVGFVRLIDRAWVKMAWSRGAFGSRGLGEGAGHTPQEVRRELVRESKEIYACCIISFQGSAYVWNLVQGFSRRERPGQCTDRIGCLI